MIFNTSITLQSLFKMLFSMMMYSRRVKSVDKNFFSVGRKFFCCFFFARKRFRQVNYTSSFFSFRNFVRNFGLEKCRGSDVFLLLSF